jgi:hypothetical protein
MIYRPRSYQLDFLKSMAIPGHPKPERQRGFRRAALVWHRRAGKDKTVLAFTQEAAKRRVGIYYYFLPTYRQAKKVVWDGIGGDGERFISHFNQADIFDKHETELKITLRRPEKDRRDEPGSIVQLIGGDNIDGVVGTNPVGVVYSEYPLMTPTAWDLVEPILAENMGWAVFVFTPRSKNHGWKLWKGAREQSDEWYSSLLTIADTRRDSPGEDRFGEPIVTEKQLDRMRARGMAEELIQQEFYCSFEGAMRGAYYADQFALLHKLGAITEVPYDPMYPVDTAWDLGLNDAMAIWFTQTVGGRCRVIDYMEANAKGLDWYATELRRKPYGYGSHYAPHDIQARELTSGNSRIEIARDMGLHFEKQPKLAKPDQIAAGRRLLPISVFDGVRCERGIAALKAYRREYDEKLQQWKDIPVHDWASNGADAWATRGIAWNANLGGSSSSRWADTRYDVWRGPTDQEYAEGVPRGGRIMQRETQTMAQLEEAPNWWGWRD